jgi:hypothetical protein
VSGQQELTTILDERQQAEQARLAGNEGRARVHARRAAGWAIGVSARRKGEDPGTPNAYRLLEWFANDPAMAESLRAAAKRLTVHITPDHELPHEDDPLRDADRIIKACLPHLAAQLADDTSD